MMNTRRLGVSVAIFTLILLLASNTVGFDPAKTSTGENRFEEAQTYTDHAAIWIDGNADFLSQAAGESWSGNGSESNPIIIEGYRITDSSTQCIRLWNVDLHWIIQDCLLEGGPPYVCGLWMANASNGLFTDNVIRNRHSAILGFGGTTNVTIANNQIYQNTASVLEVQDGMANCEIVGNSIHDNGGNSIWIAGGFENSLVSGNTISDGVYGIYAPGANDVEICENLITGTSSHGMMFLSSNGLMIANNDVVAVDDGMLVSGSETTVHSNLFENITGTGIEMASGHYCNVSFNEITNCSDYGLDLSATTTNATVRRNVFTHNGIECQVNDDGEDNEFMYNHFNDWISPDVNSDNIVDTPYSIDGEAGNEDPYPLVDQNGEIPSSTSTSTTTTTTNTGQQIPLEMVLIAGAGVLIVVLVAAFVKRGR